MPANLGQTWACEHGCDVDQFYNWDPAHYVNGVSGRNVIGVEGALWTETIRTRSAARVHDLPAAARTGRGGLVATGAAHRAQQRVRATSGSRLAGEGARLQAAGINFYPTPEVPWRLALRAGTPHQSGGGQRVSGMLAALSAPGEQRGAVHATVRWGAGETSAAQRRRSRSAQEPGERGLPHQGRAPLPRLRAASDHRARHRGGHAVRIASGCPFVIKLVQTNPITGLDH